ncbi:FixH family protein [Paenibacillus periandrae]|uniref:FixH family protein n=1 Tax=Paenibacillus periandrae TaxID=1761741 RepID=UPI001F08FD37|nr:FixH family protein [Paenibacillus periandrae]
MKSIYTSLAVVVLLLSVTGCSLTPTIRSGTADGINPQHVKAEFVLPERIAPHTEASLRVKVTDKGVQVNQGAQVDFEIWKSAEGNPSKLRLSPVYEGEGVFKAAYTFDQDGIYYLRTYVTSGDQSIMPAQRFIVGKPSDAELAQFVGKSSKPADKTSENAGGGSHH